MHYSFVLYQCKAPQGTWTINFLTLNSLVTSLKNKFWIKKPPSGKKVGDRWCTISLSKASFVCFFVCLFVCFLFYALIHGKKFYARVLNLQDMDDKESFCKAFTGEKNVSATHATIIKRKWTKTRDGVIEKETVWNDNSKIVKNKRIKWLIRQLIVNGKE